jgi:hypothetical protein
MTSALLGRNVDSVFINASLDVLENIEAGQFVPLAQSPPERVVLLGRAHARGVRLRGPDRERVPVRPRRPGRDRRRHRPAARGLRPRTRSRTPTVIERLDERYVPDEFIGREAFEERIDSIVEAYGPILEQEG